MSFTALNTFLATCVSQKKFPGCVCWVGNDKSILFFESYGYAQIIPKKIKVNKKTIFDLASITKPIATALSIMLLHEKGELKLGNKIEHFLPNFKNSTNGKRTIRDLLTHTSGIPAWFPLYLLPEEERIASLAKMNTGKKGVTYSCLGYILLGKIIEKITARTLNNYCYNVIYKKLGLKNTMFGPLKRRNNISATELGNEHEKLLASKHGDVSKANWRDYLIKGEVHDGNCFYGFNGVSGNAGLFSNATDLVKMVRNYLAGEIVKLPTLRLMIKDYTRGKEGRGLGWVINPYPGFFSPKTFSHTGFTGTMLLADPKKNLTIILLTNAVHPRVKLGIMQPIRKKVVQLTVEILSTKS